MKSNNIILFILLFASHFTIAQVGINTDQPRADLDVQGDLGIKGSIYLGDENLNEKGDKGVSGSVLVSQGEGKSPVWKVLRLPKFEPSKYVSFSNVAQETENGIKVSGGTTFTQNNFISGQNRYVENQSIEEFLGSRVKSGGVINELTDYVNINNAENKVMLSFETIVHLNTTSNNSGVEFACGIFVDNQLKGARVYTSQQIGNSGRIFYTYNLIAVAKNLPVGKRKVEVACTRRANLYSFRGDIGFGSPVHTNLNEFMTKSSLLVETFEKPDLENTNPIYTD